MTIPTRHVGYFDGFSFIPLSCLITLSYKLCRLEKEASTHLYLGYIKAECVFAGVVLVATPCCSPDGSEALPPQQRSQQPASTAGEETEGGERIMMLIVRRHEANHANLWKNTNQYLNISNLAEQLTK